MDANLNYERNILQLPKSYTNIRLGIGRANFSEFRTLAFYLNPSLVHLIGKRNSHLELNLGFKYPISQLPETITRVLYLTYMQGIDMKGQMVYSFSEWGSIILQFLILEWD